MRTESLRELASFVVRFLRKGGAIVYAAAAPCVLLPASRGGGVRSALPQALPKSVGSPARAGRSSPEAVAAVVCCGPLGRVSRRSSGRRAASAAGEQALCLQRHNSSCGCARERWVSSAICVFARYGLVCGALIFLRNPRGLLACRAQNARVHAIYADIGGSCKLRDLYTTVRRRH